MATAAALVVVADDHHEERSSPSSNKCCRRVFRYNCLGNAVRNARTHWKILVLGQVLSFLLACTGAAQSTLSFDCHLSAPTFTVGCFYFALAFCLVPVHLQHQRATRRRQELNVDEGSRNHEDRNLTFGDSTGEIHADDSRQSSSQGPEVHAPDEGQAIAVGEIGAAKSPSYSFLCGAVLLHAPPFVYFIMAVIDVYANYFTVLSFKYTTITSVTLFDALAIPTSMILSKVVLKRQFSALHFVGVFLCSIGIIMNVVQDYEEDKETASGSDNGNNEDEVFAAHRLRGDVFALLAGVMFGVNNVAGEAAVRTLGGVNEYLGMLGLFATIICTIQSAILERAEILEFFKSDANKEASCKASKLWYILAAYFVASVLSYIGGARFLQISEATFFSLSLLTGDLWSVAFSVFAEHIVPHLLFFVALVFILSGVIIYEMAPSAVLEDREREREEQHHGYDLALQRSSVDVEVLELQNRSNGVLKDDASGFDGVDQAQICHPSAALSSF